MATNPAGSPSPAVPPPSGTARVHGPATDGYRPPPPKPTPAALLRAKGKKLITAKRFLGPARWHFEAKDVEMLDHFDAPMVATLSVGGVVDNDFGGGAVGARAARRVERVVLGCLRRHCRDVIRCKDWPEDPHHDFATDEVKGQPRSKFLLIATRSFVRQHGRTLATYELKSLRAAPVEHQGLALQYLPFRAEQPDAADDAPAASGATAPTASTAPSPPPPAWQQRRPGPGPGPGGGSAASRPGGGCSLSDDASAAGSSSAGGETACAATAGPHSLAAPGGIWVHRSVALDREGRLRLVTVGPPVDPAVAPAEDWACACRRVRAHLPDPRPPPEDWACACNWGRCRRSCPCDSPSPPAAASVTV